VAVALPGQTLPPLLTAVPVWAVTVLGKTLPVVMVQLIREATEATPVPTFLALVVVVVLVVLALTLRLRFRGLVGLVLPLQFPGLR